MPATRSSARLIANKAADNEATQASLSSQDENVGKKKKATVKAKATPKRKTNLINSAKSKNAAGSTTDLTSNSIPILEDSTEPEEFVPAVLTFDFEEAKKHLIEVDHRFEDLFSKMECKPFEHLEQVHPFR